MGPTSKGGSRREEWWGGNEGDEKGRKRLRRERKG